MRAAHVSRRNGDRGLRKADFHAERAVRSDGGHGERVPTVARSEQPYGVGAEAFDAAGQRGAHIAAAAEQCGDGEDKVGVRGENGCMGILF